MASTGGARRNAMKRQKWYPNNPATPVASTQGSRVKERKCRNPGTEPNSKAMPTSKNGGTWVNSVPRKASELQSRMDAMASAAGEDIGKFCNESAEKAKHAVVEIHGKLGDI